MSDLDLMLKDFEAYRASDAYRPRALTLRRNRDCSISIYANGKLFHKLKPHWWQNHQDVLQAFLDYHFAGRKQRIRWKFK